jgi:hypothetical protein
LSTQGNDSLFRTIYINRHSLKHRNLGLGWVVEFEVRNKNISLDRDTLLIKLTATCCVNLRLSEH